MDFSFATPDEIGQELGQRVRLTRLAQDLTQAELARRAGVSIGTLRHLERQGDCGLGTVIRIAQALGVERGFDALFQPAIQSIADLAARDRALRKQRQRAPRRPSHGRSDENP
ncbi:helix-turn-helix transcriptional regulator [Bordetella genomosp. 13]|uniref:helix-turn-helix transcriptional regulator n=1 Tax=Bordetella genomosp. 13 TaxID=463040 RepID=UPI0011A687B6|nr:helix-turn-helix transcriptional regulator [Bordetella genomosp. 13]